MFQVNLTLNRDPNYHPLTVSAPEYLFGLAQFIARTIPDAEVHAHLGLTDGDCLVFHGNGVNGSDDCQLF